MNRLIPLTTALILAFVSSAAVASELGIHVNGRGTVEVEPDLGYVRMQIYREGREAPALQRELDEAMAAVLKLTDSLDINRRDVVAMATTLSPRYQNKDGESRITGLIANRAVDITLRDLSRYGDLLTQALERGVNQMEPIRLDSSERAALEEQALDLAIEDSVREAGRIAKRYGVALGPLTNVRASAHNPRPVAADAMRFSGAAESYTPGVIRIERSVSATFAIAAD